MHSVFRFLIAVIPMTTACVDLPAESTRRDAEINPNRVTGNRVTGNHLTANRVAANRVAANRITANRIAADRMTVNSAASVLIATQDGRELFSVLMACAVPENITLVAQVDGSEVEFFGELGLAPQWLDAPLDREGRGWVSACVFAKINAHEVISEISIRGPHPVLRRVSQDEREGWPLQEGAFYGNMFTPLDQPILWVACRGVDQAAGETGGLVDRDCAEEDPAHPGLTQCGFLYAGDCGNFTGEAACQRSAGTAGFYQRCHAEPIDDARHRDDDDHIFRQVITTYVVPL